MGFGVIGDRCDGIPKRRLRFSVPFEAQIDKPEIVMRLCEMRTEFDGLQITGGGLLQLIEKRQGISEIVVDFCIVWTKADRPLIALHGVRKALLEAQNVAEMCMGL